MTGSQPATDGSPKVIAMSIVIVMIEGAASVFAVKSVNHFKTMRKSMKPKSASIMTNYGKNSKKKSTGCL